MKKKLIVFSLILFGLLSFNLEFATARQEHEGQKLCIVQRGDSLWQISRRHRTNFRSLLRENDHFEDPDLVHPGNRVYLPPDAEDTEDEAVTEEEVLPPEEEVEEEPTEREPPVEDGNIAAYEAEVVELVNVERERKGLEPYQHNQQVSQVARRKSEDMRDNNYFSHQSPTYGSPFDMLEQYNVEFRAAGENIAKGQRSPAQVVRSWMDSPGHRRNILSQEFTDIGVGYAQNGDGETYWTQMFIRP
ncbi:CAP domain-containing protein [Natroniella acetigena]|uniref:CAP domain-containing protein n=1 Tax=Natroniella acetigena TaxID=52004 RepID=UPI00200A9425|nr:CAP domain-containing protein [Natroniella acetigena]MCK8826959.1 CAP domain-containing protein [Natroniella acetigena]